MRYDTIRYDMIRYDTIRYDTIRFDAMRCDTIRYYTVRYDTIQYDIRYDTIQYDILYDTNLHDTISRDVRILRGHAINSEFIVAVVIPSFHINLTLSREVAELGEDLKAYCHVNRTSSDVDVIPVVEKKKNYQVIWFKILPESGGEEVEIATNGYLNEEFQETGRFTAGLQMLNPGDISSVEFSLYLNSELC